MDSALRVFLVDEVVEEKEPKERARSRTGEGAWETWGDGGCMLAAVALVEWKCVLVCGRFFRALLYSRQ
jgi:hypothetical protein